jgi:23S rRNA (pseudouridine1915-N3)-methyltransferase
MRIVVAAVGRLKAGADRELVERYSDRAAKLGRTLGVRGVEIIEVRESRARETERRITEEAIALATVIPNGAALILLDGRGENVSSDSLAGLLRGWRDNARGLPASSSGAPMALAPPCGTAPISCSPSDRLRGRTSLFESC